MTQHLYTKTSHSVTVSVRSIFLDTHSEPESNQYLWAYHIRIHNRRAEAIQLRSRYWQITDDRGHVIEVRGGGVVGEQPLLRPGEVYEYTSGTPLGAPSGIMVGSYRMETEKGELLEVAVPAFPLESPFQKVILH